MRSIDVCFWVPRSGQEHRKLDLANLIRSESDLRFAVQENRGLPDQETLNRVFRRGSGDDGFIPMTWVPFEIDAIEYSELMTMAWQ
jgi:hypothetical protein